MADSAFEFSFARAGLRLSQLANHAAVQGRYDTEGQRLEKLTDLASQLTRLTGELLGEIAAQAGRPRKEIDAARACCLNAWSDDVGFEIARAANALLDEEAEAHAASERRHRREESRADLFV